MFTPSTKRTIRLTKHLIAAKSQRLIRFFTEPIYNLETREYYSSRFQKTTYNIIHFLGQRWKPLAIVTVCLIKLLCMFSVVNPTIIYTIPITRRRLGECTGCNGTGEVPGMLWGTNECSRCEGQGKVSKRTKPNYSPEPSSSSKYIDSAETIDSTTQLVLQNPNRLPIEFDKLKKKMSTETSIPIDCKDMVDKGHTNCWELSIGLTDTRWKYTMHKKRFPNRIDDFFVDEVGELVCWDGVNCKIVDAVNLKNTRAISLYRRLRVRSRTTTLPLESSVCPMCHGLYR